jgi:hypothetical protein
MHREALLLVRQGDYPARVGVWESWLESQVSQSAPNRSFGAAQAQRCVRELAQACGAIEHGAGNVYGTQIDASRHAEMAPLLPRMRSRLAEWGEVLQETFGADGRRIFDDICKVAGVVVVAAVPVVESSDAYPELEAFRKAPGDRLALAALAGVLVDRGDPIGVHLRNALELEGLPRGTPRFFELSRAVEETQTRERERLASLIWPAAMVEVAENAYFRRGLPVDLMLDAETLGRFAPALWARAPIAEAHLRLHGNEKIDATLARHPALARATSLAVSFGAFSTTDIGPLLEREGPAIEALHVVWTNARRLAQLKKLRHPAALRRLSLTSPPEGKKRVLTAAEIDGLAGMGLSGLRELVLTLVGLKNDGIEALARTAWPLETLALHVALAPGSIAALAASPVLAAVKTLVLRGTPLGEDGAAALAASPRLQQLVCLDLRQSIGQELGAFVEALALPNLRSLILGGRALHPDVMRTIASSSALSELVELDLAGGDIGDEGLAALAEATNLRALRRLSLRGNGITDAGVVAMREAAWFAQLEELDLEANKIEAAKP